MAKATGTELVLIQELPKADVLFVGAPDERKTLTKELSSMARKARAAAKGLDPEKPADRAKMKSIASTVSKSKTFLTNHCKDWVADAEARLKEIRTNRIWAEQCCDALRDEIKGPVTEWEAAEAERVSKLEKELNWLKDTADPLLVRERRAKTAAELEDSIGILETTPITEDRYGEFFDEAVSVQTRGLVALREALPRQKLFEEQEARQAELDAREAELRAREADMQEFAAQESAKDDKPVMDEAPEEQHLDGGPAEQFDHSGEDLHRKAVIESVTASLLGLPCGLDDRQVTHIVEAIDAKAIPFLQITY